MGCIGSGVFRTRHPGAIRKDELLSFSRTRSGSTLARRLAARLAAVGVPALLAGCQALSSLTGGGDIQEPAFRPSESPVTVDSVSRNDRLAALGFSPLPLADAHAAPLRGKTGAVKFGLRPEHIGVLPRPRGDAHAVAAQLDFVEHMGNEVFVHVQLGGAPVTARVPAEEAGALTDAPRGTEHTVYLQMAHCQLFDADDGRTLQA